MLSKSLSDGVLGETLEGFGLAVFHSGDLLQQGAIHFCLFRVHHSTKGVLPPVLNIGALFLTCSAHIDTNHGRLADLVLEVVLVL